MYYKEINYDNNDNILNTQSINDAITETVNIAVIKKKKGDYSR